MPLAPLALVPLLVGAAAVGLVAGGGLTVVVHRIPRGTPLRGGSRCPRCGSVIRGRHTVPIVSWLALHGRCAACRGAIPVRYPLVELGTAGVFVAAAWLLCTRQSAGAGEVTALLAHLFFASLGIALALIDLDVHRLPDVLVLPGYVVAAALLTLSCVLGEPWEALARAGAGMTLVFGFYLCLYVARPAGMGGGDVKLGGLIGLYLGWTGWSAVIVGVCAAFVMGGLFGLVLMAFRRARRGTAIAFGPWMILGCWLGIAAA